MNDFNCQLRAQIVEPPKRIYSDNDSAFDCVGDDMPVSYSSTTRYTFGSPVSGDAGESLWCLSDDVLGGTLAVGSVEGERTKRLGV